MLVRQLVSCLHAVFVWLPVFTQARSQPKGTVKWNFEPGRVWAFTALPWSFTFTRPHAFMACTWTILPVRLRWYWNVGTHHQCSVWWRLHCWEVLCFARTCTCGDVGNKSDIRNKIRYVADISCWVEEFGKRTGTKWKLRASKVIGQKHLWWWVAGYGLDCVCCNVLIQWKGSLYICKVIDNTNSNNQSLKCTFAEYKFVGYSYPDRVTVLLTLILG